MKKLLSLVCAFSILVCSLATSASAVDVSSQNAEKVDDVVYVNGVKVATIQVSNEVGVEPRTGWMTQESVLYGTSPSDYTKFISSRDVDVQLENDLTSLGISGLAIAIGVLVPPAGVCSSIALTIAGVLQGSKYAYAKTLYFHEEIYGHKDLPSMWQQVRCTYYFDKAHKEYAGSGTYYRAWG